MLTVTAVNVTSVTIDVGRARVSCAVALRVLTDTPLTIRLAGCDRTETVEANLASQDLGDHERPDLLASLEDAPALPLPPAAGLPQLPLHDMPFPGLPPNQGELGGDQGAPVPDVEVDLGPGLPVPRP